MIEEKIGFLAGNSSGKVSAVFLTAGKSALAHGVCPWRRRRHRP